MLPYRSLIISLTLVFINCCSFAFQLQPGDLLFSQEACGDFCTAIDLTTEGVDHARITHVALVLDNPNSSPNSVIEATQSGVVITPLNQFLDRSSKVANKPHVWVGRLKTPYQTLIPQALTIAKSELNKPYNTTFTDTSGSTFYCSQLITDSFYRANDNHAVFQLQPMNFKDPTSGKTLLIWQQYYQKMQLAVPQDQLGSNPGELSRDPKIIIVYSYFNQP